MRTVANSKFGNAARRWAGIGPYYAMFPVSFAESVVQRYTQPGDVVLDPFAGRGTAVYAAAVNARSGIGIEINPVGYIYTQTKLRPAQRTAVENRIVELSRNAWRFKSAALELPEFFRHCFCASVRRFLLAARSWLDWQSDYIDRTVMGLLLVHLHGKRTDSMSNQMRQTKSMSPQYAVRWWKERDLSPPNIDPIEFMQKKLDWRYAKGTPDVHPSRTFLGDSERQASYLKRTIDSLGVGRVRLLLTSPPYCGVTNYHYDQWLRLWLLGGAPEPTAPAGPNQGKFVDRKRYLAMLKNVFCRCASVLAADGVVYVRTDSRKLTLEATIEALRVAFPKKKMRKRSKPIMNPTQTELFGGKSNEDGEVDILLQ